MPLVTRAMSTRLLTLLQRPVVVEFDRQDSVLACSNKNIDVDIPDSKTDTGEGLVAAS